MNKCCVDFPVCRHNQEFVRRHLTVCLAGGWVNFERVPYDKHHPHVKKVITHLVFLNRVVHGPPKDDPILYQLPDGTCVVVARGLNKSPRCYGI